MPIDEETPGMAAPLRTLPIVRSRIRARIVLAWPAAGPASPAARALLDRLHDALPKAPAP
ncbi:hypothetical protein OG618_35485 [Kitasatospora sp. NBC_01246]|uniref:hypothetical protein n=1 Tax=Kitasatospora sp. NBC_01246 TaxID=2903570 RepID=UPI002E36D1C1|nr:hypothetical protein [Kitasatospora sp. NBC_01246]